MKKNLKPLSYPAILIVAAVILSCKNSPQVKAEAKSDVIVKMEATAQLETDSLIKDQIKVDTVPAVKYDIYRDDVAAFISGMAHGKSGCLPKLDSTKYWKRFSKELDSLFGTITTGRFKKMTEWADSEFVKTASKPTIFYPFSGPDILNANIFYPNADKYIMIAMEPIGSFPDLCNMHPDSVKSYLGSVNYSLRDIFKRSYFITSRMNTDLSKTKVNGTLPLIALFLKRTGHQIVSVEKIAVDTTGKCQVVDNYNAKNIITGVKVDFTAANSTKIQSVYYFRTDISDKGLEKNKGFSKYLASLPVSNTYLKAASYLMHYDEFSKIRNIIFEKSSTILQDDSGIAYKYFDKKLWDIHLYGDYAKPIGEFTYISEPDLEKAYKTTKVEPLTYTLGYNWRTGHINMLYSVKK